MFDAGVNMAQINRLEDAGLLDEQQAERLRQLMPGAAEAQQAETDLRNAQAAESRQRVELAKMLGTLPKEKLVEEINKLRQDIEQGKATIELEDDQGRKFKVPSTQYLEALIRSLGSRGESGGLTEFQRNQIQRQEREDIQRDEDQAAKAEGIIQNPKEGEDVTSQANIFNTRSRADYAYLPKVGGRSVFNPNAYNPFAGRAPGTAVKIPLPKLKKPGTDAIEQLTARELMIMFNNRQLRGGRSFQEFLLHVWEDMAKQPAPKELRD